MQKAKIQDTETAPEQVKEDKALKFVIDKYRKKYGKDAVITKDSPKPKPPSAVSYTHLTLPTKA